MNALQKPLFEDIPRRRRQTLQERFEAWVKDNPEMVNLFLCYARQAKTAGLHHYGVKAIAERVRWHVEVETKGEVWKMNNNYPSRLARLLVRRDPSLDGLFEMRKLRS